MNLDNFVKDFITTLETPGDTTITADTKLSDIKQFDSMAVLSVIAMMHKVYKTRIKGSDIKKAITVADLFALVTEVI
jgi:acyl carrier protein